MKKQLSAEERLGAYMAAAMHEAMELLGWEHDRYAEYQFECSANYLWAQLRGQTDSIAWIAGKQTYVDWWRLHWYLRDKVWLRDCRRVYCDPAIISPLASQIGRRASYLSLHNPSMLAKGKTISGRRMSEGFMQMLVRL